MLAEQRHRAFTKQQQRNEQQKVWRELQRDQERLWEAYYMKHHNLAGAKNPIILPGDDSPRSSGDEASSKEEAPTKDIYKDTLRSHKRYAETVDRWKDFVAENERRTEAHWLKVLGVSGLKELQDKKGKSLRRSVRNVGNMKQFIAQVSVSSTNPSSAKSSSSQTTPQKVEEDGNAGSGGSSLAASPSSSDLRASTSVAGWQQRILRCKNKEAEDIQKGQERMLQKTNSVLEARQRQNEANLERTNKYKKNFKEWEKKCAAAAAKRDQTNMRTVDEVIRKQVEWLEKRNQEVARLNEERFQTYGAKWDMIRNAQATSSALLEKKVVTTKAKKADKDARSGENIRQVLEEFEQKMNSPAHAEKLAQGLAKKKQLEQDLVSKTQRDVGQKEIRTMGALKRVKSTTFENSRQARRTRSSSRSPNSELSGILSPISMPSPKSDGVDDNVLLTQYSLPALNGVHPRRSSLIPTEEEEEASGERDFLEELKDRSTKWLYEMRKDMD